MGPKQVINIVLIIPVTLSIFSLCEVLSQKIHRMNCRNEATLKAIDKDFMVKESSSKFISSTSVLLLPHCARNCLKTSECKSVIYKKIPATPTEKNCQILNVEKSALVSNDKQSSAGWIYYEPLQQVLHYSFMTRICIVSKALIKRVQHFIQHLAPKLIKTR